LYHWVLSAIKLDDPLFSYLPAAIMSLDSAFRISRPSGVSSICAIRWPMMSGFGSFIYDHVVSLRTLNGDPTPSTLTA
jgi:hypothetical protein